MRFTTDGIGWLAAGVIIILTSITKDDIPGMIGIIALGAVPVLVYFMKQYFEPVRIGWFLTGGALIAFCTEQTARMISDVITVHDLSGKDLSDTLIVLIAGACMLGIFAAYNRRI